MLKVVTGVFFALALSSPASAQVYVNVPPPQVGPVDQVANLPNPQVLGVSGQFSGPSAQVAGTSAQVAGTSGLVVGGQSQRPAVVLSAGQQPTQARGLALTGGDIIGICLLALSAVVIGLALVRGARRATAN